MTLRNIQPRLTISIAKREGTREPNQGNSVLQGKDLLGLWQKILRTKDAKELFEEMRSPLASPKRDTSRIPEGRTLPELQRGVNQQERVQNNPSGQKANDGTPPNNGETPKKEIKGKRRSPPQQRIIILNSSVLSTPKQSFLTLLLLGYWYASLSRCHS